ncbi:Damage-inducible protein DinB [Planctomycetales bacterium 10988]|nr:Damage-inducible protein DinB [Planctomycetales bacterium 10988]
MQTLDLIRRLHEHRHWSNQRLLAAVQTLSPEQLRQSFPIGQGSIWNTLVHLMSAEYIWLEALLGDESPVFPGDLPGQLPGNQQGVGAIQSLEELTFEWHALQDRWNRYLLQLTEEELHQTIYKTSTSSGFGQKHGTTCVDILLHVCTHAQYTSAQLINMLRQQGHLNLPDLQLITLARQEAAVA